MPHDSKKNLLNGNVGRTNFQKGCEVLIPDATAERGKPTEPVRVSLSHTSTTRTRNKNPRLVATTVTRNKNFHLHVVELLPAGSIHSLFRPATACPGSTPMVRCLVVNLFLHLHHLHLVCGQGRKKAESIQKNLAGL